MERNKTSLKLNMSTLYGITGEQVKRLKELPTQNEKDEYINRITKEQLNMLK